MFLCVFSDNIVPLKEWFLRQLFWTMSPVFISPKQVHHRIIYFTGDTLVCLQLCAACGTAAVFVPTSQILEDTALLLSQQ